MLARIKKSVPQFVKTRIVPYYLLVRYLRRSYASKKIRETVVDTENIKLPKVVNFNANDICNSKCVMCNIWEQKQGFEISPEQLRKVLSNPLFAEVQYVGITGGEPTLREDLPQLYEAVIEAIPGIVGLSIITNCIKERDVIDRIEKVIAVCARHQKHFSMMVSLDGFEDTHDAVRRRPGNFQSALRVIEHFTAKGIDIAIGATISKINVWEIDELLDFLIERKIYGRFRVAEFIKRLYNDNRADVIRNFDEDERYHLVLFFHKLLYRFEFNPVYQRTYKSIINILDGGERLIGCPYQAEGVVLNARGELAYCAPKSDLIGNTIEGDALEIYKQNLSERKRILAEHCDSCIHDYHAPITLAETEVEVNELLWRQLISFDETKISVVRAAVKPVRKGKLQVFITGWYGTETVGDKAILGGIIDELVREHGTNITLVVTSLYPFVTRRTAQELEIDLIVIPVYHSDFVAYAKGSDIIIMGGGPIMDIGELTLPLHAFLIAKSTGAKAIIFGCGIGPLVDVAHQNAAKRILNLADEIRLRDEKSMEVAREWVKTKAPITVIGDPAKVYLQRFLVPKELNNDTPGVLRCFLREWTYEYSRNLSYEDFIEARKEFERSLANFIKQKALDLAVEEIVFEHMHNFAVGNDDRDFSRRFIRAYFSGDQWNRSVSYNKKLSTVASIVEAMRNSTHNVCMRFHSVVFAHTLKTSYTAIDYTRGGKILNFLKDNNSASNMIGVDELVESYS